MADRNIEVIVDDSAGAKGNRFLTANVMEKGRGVASVSVPIDATPEEISEAFKRNAEETTSRESHDLLNQASKLVPGLEKK